MRFSVPRRRGFLGVGVITLSLFAGVQATANEAIDPTTTASVSQTVVTDQLRRGSAGYRRALDLLDAGKAAEAYQAARAFEDNVERRTIQWAAIYFFKGKVDHDSIRRFSADAPDFATASLYQTRLEQSLVEARPDKDEVIRFLGGQMPQTVEAQILLARAYVADGQVARAGRIARSIWIGNFLDREQEAEMLGAFGSLLNNADHWARAVHLLMHDRASGAERIMSYLTPAQKSLALARIAVSRKQSDAQALLDKVDPAYRDHPLFFFARGQLARDQGALATAVTFLNRAEGELPDAAEWWYERRLIARQALALGDARTAYEAAAGYTNGPEGRLVDANFHAGWIALAFLNDPRTAITHFERMRTLSTLPDSITQSNYWLGKAYLAAGNGAAAREHFSHAASYRTVFYGQLARQELNLKGVGIRALPAWQQAEPLFEQRELVRAIRLLIASGKKNYAETLISRLIYRLDDAAELLLAARLAQSIDAHNLAIIAADVAERKGTPLDLFNFPKDGLPPGMKLAAIDKAAIYAVARQESRFDADAISHAGARGLMQLMPGTAKETAGKIGLAYSPGRLTSDPEYNALLGSTYLQAQLDRYEGSLVLAAAAYNAGAGNVNKWLRTFGDPREAKIDPVIWIEAIPFDETRNYVQRVMGNYMVYRARLGDDSMTLGHALRRIPH